VKCSIHNLTLAPQSRLRTGASIPLLWDCRRHTGVERQREIFYGGDTKCLPGENIELPINARAGCTLEAIQIVPEYAPLADLLGLIELASTPALRNHGLGDCNNGLVCAVVYVNGKSFPADTLLATLRFTIGPTHLLALCLSMPG